MLVELWVETEAFFYGDLPVYTKKKIRTDGIILYSMIFEILYYKISFFFLIF